MKRVMAVLLTISMVLCLLTACSPSPEEMIAKGDAAFKTNNLDEALDCYKQAGEAGDAKEKEILMIMVRNILKEEKRYSIGNTEGVKLGEADKLLQEKAKYSFKTEADRYAFLIECVDAYIEGVCSEPTTHALYEAEDWISAVKSKAPKETPNLDAFVTEKEAFLNEQYFTLGYNQLTDARQKGYDKLKDEVYDAKNSWENCTEGPGRECVEAMESFMFGMNYKDAIPVLGKHIPDAQILKAVCDVLKENISFGSVDDVFAYTELYRASISDEGFDMSLTEAFSQIGHNSGNDYKFGNSPKYGSIQVTQEELQASCGKNPEGGIIFLHKPSKYDPTVELNLNLLDLLPTAYYPRSLETVEYVVLLSCETVSTGNTFGSSTKELREDTTLTLYDAKTGQVLFEETKQGPTTMMMSYSGSTPPSVYSHGAPYMGDLIQEAVAVIENATR